MSTRVLSPWHKATFDQFLNEWLPQLLVTQLPLVGYQIEHTGRYTYTMQLVLTTQAGDVTVEYTDLPQPDEEGIFEVSDTQYVVVPYASTDDLANAQIYCVGEQLLQYFQQHLRYQAPPDISWNEALIKTWLPIKTWMHEFFTDIWWEQGSPVFVQRLDQLNWLAWQAHLRRLYIKNRTKLFTPSHFGRTCPFEAPEGPNIGRIVQIAVGAEVVDGKLVVTDKHPVASLGLAASMIPLLDHDDPMRLLMGANMMRQWLKPLTSEPALVQSGNEPDIPDFWCGRNLLTAFIAWGVETFEDGIIISESCARRLNYAHPVEPGDKVSTRHGTKGVVSRILPDREMPHLQDGTPVELIYNFISIHARMYFGQIREAVLGRIAHVEGEPLIISPFEAPDAQSLRQRLVQHGLPQDGMEILIDGRSGKPLSMSSTVGWVYWGRLMHVAREKLHTSFYDKQGQRQEELEYYALRDAGAFANVLEQFNVRAMHPGNKPSMEARIATGKSLQADMPSPQFTDLTYRLASMGIRTELTENALTFHLAPPSGEVLTLARPVPHPWLRHQEIAQIGLADIDTKLPEYKALIEANTRLERMQHSHVPAGLYQQGLTQLTERVRAFSDVLLTPAQVRFSAHVASSARAVIVPGAQLHYDQIGLAEDIAWALFTPLLAQEIDRAEIAARSTQATQALDTLMARSWVIVHRAPSLSPNAFVACRPVRDSGRVIRLHPLVSRVLRADFDGDQVSVFLPITAEAQQEAEERLSLVGHLTRIPELLKTLTPANEALWGLAYLSLTVHGRADIEKLLHMGHQFSEEGISREKLTDALRACLQEYGPQRTLEIIDHLLALGFRVTKETGASINPFVGTAITYPAMPEDTHTVSWGRYLEECMEQLAPRKDYMEPDLGPQLLAVKSGAWGEVAQLVKLTTAQGIVKDIQGDALVIRHGFRDGLEPEEAYTLAIGAREAIARIQQEMEQLAHEVYADGMTKSFHVLARAMRAQHPGLVFAHAASIGEIDPLTDMDSRLFVGLPPLSN